MNSPWTLGALYLRLPFGKHSNWGREKTICKLTEFPYSLCMLMSHPTMAPDSRNGTPPWTSMSTLPSLLVIASQALWPADIRWRSVRCLFTYKCDKRTEELCNHETILSRGREWSWIQKQIYGTWVSLHSDNHCSSLFIIARVLSVEDKICI